MSDYEADFKAVGRWVAAVRIGEEQAESGLFIPGAANEEEAIVHSVGSEAQLELYPGDRIFFRPENPKNPRTRRGPITLIADTEVLMYQRSVI